MATQNQALVSGALQQFKLEVVSDPTGKVGGPQKLKVTKETIDYLTSVVGKTFVVDGAGDVNPESAA